MLESEVIAIGCFRQAIPPIRTTNPGANRHGVIPPDRPGGLARAFETFKIK